MTNQEKATFKLGGNFIAFTLALVSSPSKGGMGYLVEGSLLFSFSSGYKEKSGACLKHFLVSLWVSQETDFSTVAFLIHRFAFCGFSYPQSTTVQKY